MAKYVLEQTGILKHNYAGFNDAEVNCIAVAQWNKLPETEREKYWEEFDQQEGTEKKFKMLEKATQKHI